MNSVTFVRRIQCEPQIEKMPKNSSWKKVAVAVIPLFGVLGGFHFMNDHCENALSKGDADKLSALKEIRHFQWGIVVNTFTYGIATMAYSYHCNDWRLFAAGVVQISVGLEHINDLRKENGIVARELKLT